MAGRLKEDLGTSEPLVAYREDLQCISNYVGEWWVSAPSARMRALCVTRGYACVRARLTFSLARPLSWTYCCSINKVSSPVPV